MQRDLLWLLSGLTMSLGVAGLSACDDAPSGQASSSAQAPTLSSALARPAGSDGEAAHPPSGRWCAAPPLAQGMRFLGSPDVGGCPKFVDADKMPKGKDSSPEYVELPRSSNAFYDEILTKMRRADVNHAPLCCYNWHEKTPGGRPLLSEGQALTASLLSDAVSLADVSPAETMCLERPPAALREQLVQHWLELAQLEHASVASFARARLELLSLGAPRALLQGYAQAARDELQHLEVCLGVAHSWGAPRTRLGPLRLPCYDRSQVPAAGRHRALTELAQRTLQEGLEPESAAALGLYRASQRAACPELSALLARLAHDERRHAALALATLRWCQSQGVSVAPPAAWAAEPQLTERRAARLLADEATVRVSAAQVMPGTASAWGQIGPAEWQALRDYCRTDLLEPYLRQLAAA